MPLIALVRGDPKNLVYFLQEDRAKPGHFIFYEIFASQADFDAHNAMPYVQEWFAKLPELADGGVEVMRMAILADTQEMIDLLGKRWRILQLTDDHSVGLRTSLVALVSRSETRPRGIAARAATKCPYARSSKTKLRQPHSYFFAAHYNCSAIMWIDWQ